MARIVVLGGGIAGLSAAHELLELGGGHSIELLERETRLGGKIRSTLLDGFVLDEGPDSLLTRKRAAVELCTEIGIADRLVGRSARGGGSYIYHGGRLHSLPEGFSGLVPSNPSALDRTTLLSDEAKARVKREAEVPPASEEVGEETVASFLSRRFGREAFEVMIEPLVSGIFAGDARSLSARAALPQLVALERRRGSLSGPEPTGTAQRPADLPQSSALPPFVSFPNGLEEIVTALASRLSPVRLATGAAVEGVQRLRRGVSVRMESGESVEADVVISTIPAAEAGRVLAALDSRLSESLLAIEYASAVVVNLGFRSSDVPGELDGYGYLSPMVDGRSFHGCTWSSRKWPGRAPEGFALLRLYGGRYGEEGLLDSSDEEIESLARTEVAQSLAITASPVLVRVARWRRALPQYNLGYPALLDTVEERVSELDGIFLAGAAFRGVGIPDCIDSGRSAAHAAIEYITHGRGRER